MEGYLSNEYSNIIRRDVPINGKILEAGCGVRQVVLALRNRGYDCYGLDNAQRTIDLLRVHFPDLPFKFGDVKCLPFEDGFFDAYISLGVIEHFVEGQEDILFEAACVLRPEGKILLSVPTVNSYRSLRCRLGL